MILKMFNGTISVEPLPIPTPCNKIFVRYLFERNTNHLIPHLYINNILVAEGENKFITLDVEGTEIDIKIKLVDSLGNLIKEYQGRLPYYSYCIIGRKPVRQDVDSYIHSLEERIKELEEQGEVI